MRRNHLRQVFWAGLLGLAVLGAVPISFLRAADYYTGNPTPIGALRIARPTITWKIWGGEKTKITAVSMALNNREVPAEYFGSYKAVIYTPPRPLPPGSYQVRCEVTFNNRWKVSREWEFTIPPEAIQELPEPDARQRRAWETANEYRRLMGMFPFRLDLRLCASATAHASYLDRNKETGHAEQPGKPGFVGKDPMERAIAFGYDGGCSEDAAGGDLSPSAAVRELFDAPYHRLPFLQPGSPDFGAGRVGDQTVLVFGATEAEGIVTYPVDKQREIPLRWHGIEDPNPLRIHRVRGPAGYIITFCYFAPDRPRIRISKATLTTEKGEPVPFYLNTPDNDSHLTNGALLIPKQSLRQNTTYLVSIEASTQSGKNISRNWQFTTTHASKADSLPFAEFDLAIRGAKRILKHNQVSLVLKITNRAETPTGTLVIRLSDKKGRTLLTDRVSIAPGKTHTIRQTLTDDPATVTVVPMYDGIEDKKNTITLPFDR